MSDVTLLRTMTEKSYFKAGKYEGMRVGEVFKLGLIGVDYLVRTYYKYEKISFCDEFLDQLGIDEELRIEKPGKAESEATMFYKWRDKNRNDDDWLERYNQKQNELKETRFRERRYDNKTFSKGNMQRKNHGH